MIKSLTPIRVLHVLGALNIGGAESMVMNLYRKIDREQVQFDFVIHTMAHCDFTDEIVELGGHIYSCPRYSGNNHFQYCRWWKDFLKKHQEYHIIHGHVRSTAAIYLYIAKKMNRITIAHSHSTSNGKGISACVKDCMQLPIRYIADYLFACSEKAGKWLYGSNVVYKSNFRIIVNGIELERFLFNRTVREQIRKQLNISKDTVVIGHVGRFIEPKNHMFLMEVFTQFHKKFPNSKLLLVGDGELADRIRQKAVENEISENVCFVGNQNNTENYYQVMDVFAFPSLWEGLGMVAIEAQVNGLAVIASDRVPKEIQLTEKVFFAAINDRNEWIQMLEDNCHRKESDDVSRESLRAYDVNYIAKELQEFYKNL